MALVDTSTEWGNDTIRFRLARKWNEPEAIVRNDERIQIKVRDPIITAGLLGAINVTYTAWSDWKDLESMPLVDIVSAP